MKSNRVSISNETIELLKPYAEPFEDLDSCIKRVATAHAIENQKVPNDRVREQAK